MVPIQHALRTGSGGWETLRYIILTKTFQVPNRTKFIFGFLRVANNVLKRNKLSKEKTQKGFRKQKSIFRYFFNIVFCVWTMSIFKVEHSKQCKTNLNKKPILAHWSVLFADSF